MIHDLIEPIVEHLYQHLPKDRKETIDRFRQVLYISPNPSKNLVLPQDKSATNTASIVDLTEAAIKNHLILGELIKRKANPDTIATASFLAAAFFCELEKESDTQIFEKVLKEAILPTFTHGVVMLSAPHGPRSNPLRDVLIEISSEHYEKTGVFPTWRQVINTMSNYSEDHPVIREIFEIDEVVSWSRKNGSIADTSFKQIQNRLTSIKEKIKLNKKS